MRLQEMHSTMMSKYYKEDAVMAQRGFKLAGNRSYAVVRDEISLKGNSDVLSFIHTQADILLHQHRVVASAVQPLLD